MTESCILWVILASVILFGEIISLGLTTIWFAIGALCSALLAYLDINVYIQLIVFILVSLVLLVLLRKFAKKVLNTSRQCTNVDTLIGSKGIVTKEIDSLNYEGRINIQGQDWKAKSDENIGKSECVEVVGIQGVSLIVKKINKKEV